MELSVVLTYGLLLLSVISLWIKKKILGKISPWLFFLSLSFTSSLIFNFAGYTSVLYALVFGIVAYIYSKTKSTISFFIIFLLAVPLLMHMPFTAFQNHQFLNAVKITPNAIPYSLYFNLDKTLIALFIIGFGIKHKKTNWLLLLKKTAIYLFIMVAALLILALLLGYTQFQPKIPSFTLVWMLVNLFFVCTAEEALFRKLLVDKTNSLFHFKNSHWAGIIISALLFGIAHYQGGIIYVALAFIAGLFYAHIYSSTQKIESSILLHFFFNLTHFIFFTYPALA